MTDSGTLSDDIGWWRRFLTGWNGAVESILDWGKEGLEDHRMSNYRQQIAGALRRQGSSGITAVAAPPGVPNADPVAVRVKPRRRAA